MKFISILIPASMAIFMGCSQISDGEALASRNGAVDQQTRRRISRLGLTTLDETKASLGYTLYAPMHGAGEVYLIDYRGRVVHEWKMPYPPGQSCYLLPNGNLFYAGKVQDETSNKIFKGRWKFWKGGVMLEADWDSNVIWQHFDPYQHHVAKRTPSGGAIYLTIERLTNEMANRVQGGIPNSGFDGLWADVIVEVDSAGNKIWEWHASDHLDPARDRIPDNLSRNEWTHGNSVTQLEGERVLVSFRHISTVAIIDKRTGEFVWRLGPQVLSQQHDPSLLPNGNVLVFDNGLLHTSGHLPFSRVIEVDPKTNKIAWRYQDRPKYNFYSPYISGCQRLKNGNTLITEGNFGRMFQVTREGEVVWEYINPNFVVDMRGTTDNEVFHARHYLADQIPALQ